MVNYNGNIQENSNFSIESNRGFLYGDAIFETIKVLDNKVLFLEDHYFRLMASMRICRMEIPMNFTMEFFEEQILKLTNSLEKSNYEVELYKDFFIPKQLLSTLKTNNKMLQITGSIFAKENGYDNCLVLNDEKNVVEALQSNLFMKIGNVVVTPPISDGCLNGIMRKQVIEILNKMDGIEVKETSISPFDLQKADELFLTNVITGIQPITKYRKKEYTANFSNEILVKLNAKIRLS